MEASMSLVLTGARVVTPNAVLEPGTVVIDGDRIVDVTPGARTQGPFDRHTIVPGFIDVHVHGLEGVDALTTPDGVREMARRFPRFGVTAFCPTSIACAPHVLRGLFEAIDRARESPEPAAARVLPAHLESNFINPEFRGAQPLACLRHPPRPVEFGFDAAAAGPNRDGDFTGADILAELDRGRSAVGIVTLAPELPGVLDLIRALVARGHRASLGHSAATYEEGLAGIEAGARHATHLFNRMPPFSHRAPGLVGAVLSNPEMMPELVSDGYHVHPVVARAILPALGRDRLIAITDGTAAAGLPPGSRAHIGNLPITATDTVALLDDGTFAGSILTMDGAFRNVVNLFGMDLVAASRACSTNPARALKLEGLGEIAPGATADLAVLDEKLRVVQTYIAGEPAISR
jgi:N-acetylglucosamine-6-phosphate deacetylase